MNKLIITLIISLIFLVDIVNSQSLTDIQRRNARATGYAIVAAKNPGIRFAIYVIHGMV